MTRHPIGSLATIAALEEERRRAMLGADTGSLRALMADGLQYVHSNGKADSRDALLGKIASGEIVYRRIENSGVQFVQLGDGGFAAGVMRADIVRDQVLRQVESRYLAVWMRRSGSWELAAFQATPIRAS